MRTALERGGQGRAQQVGDRSAVRVAVGGLEEEHEARAPVMVAAGGVVEAEDLAAGPDEGRGVAPAAPARAAEVSRK